MAKTYTLQGPIQLSGMSATEALTFAGVVINAVPAYSMGTATLHLRATGDAGTQSTECEINGDTLDNLKASLESVRNQIGAASTPETIVYDLMGNVNLVGLSLEDGIGVVDAALHNIPGDSLVQCAMVAKETAT